MAKIAVLTSGGIDSNVLAAHLLKRYEEVTPIYIRSGLVWERAELFWLKKYLGHLKSRRLKPLVTLVLPVDDIDSKGWGMSGRGTPGYRSRDNEVYLPGRNLLLLSKAAVFCASKKIPTLAIGTLAGNPFPDATLPFFDSTSQTISLALGFRIEIAAPFRELTKQEVVERGKKLPLHLSFSCLKPRGFRHCHRCNKCAERDRFITVNPH